ncbi:MULTISPECIES: hypothetical protein [unclassified Chelatococcus]|uniref:hypothetical protein n=1 Tax=unclassified Chelatococcus TaxID=2638111 RepID=UPI001BCCD714|nr:MULTISPECIES: hypothetical protein [unclassified Chelatococcus]MBS7699196.1 hypothetical protein [Chelatococcus sp. YT9]MBX3554977.1 hypothetical protein [Chelatococcus sp.]
MANTLTKSQVEALRWLREHNGEGMFTNVGTLLAAGEIAPVVRSTWNALAQAGFVEFHGGKSGRGRLRIIEKAATP